MQGKDTKPCQAEFGQQMVYVKERQKEKEQEIEGGWYTEERMASELKYSAKPAKIYICFVFACILLCDTKACFLTNTSPEESHQEDQELLREVCSCPYKKVEV